MSDLGSLIEVKHLDGRDMEAQDRIQLEQAIQIIQATDKYEDVSGEPFSFKISLGNDINGVKNIAVILSEYWLEGVDGGDYNLSVEEILETDLPKVQAVKEELAAAIGTKYTLNVICDCW